MDFLILGKVCLWDKVSYFVSKVSNKNYEALQNVSQWFLMRRRNTLTLSMFRNDSQCCQLSDFVARFNDFSDPFSDFSFKKRLATNLVTFGKTLAAFQMSPVLSCEREILSYTSPCVCSDQWALAPAESISTFQWPHGSWHRCQWAAHVHTVLPRTNHLPTSP